MVKVRDREVAPSEGSLVRSPADLYRDYGVGRVVKVPGDQANVEFNPSVFKPRRGRIE
jgi:hypothetical protein